MVSREFSVDNEEVGTLDPLSGESDVAEDDDQNDLDDYHPARSSSPSIAPSQSSQSGALRRPTSGTSVRQGRTARSKKGKAKGSAALALAVVTQLGEARRQKQNLRQLNADLDEFDPVRVYQEGCVTRKRKNQPIPVPVPVPNLNKNCRGRKVPFVAKNFATLTNAGGDGDGVAPIRTLNMDLGERVKREEDGYLPKAKRTRRKGNSVPTNAPDENTTTRSYVCTLSGCGKCFVRGEHLKRHVRSIHTHDKRKYLFFSVTCVFCKCNVHWLRMSVSSCMPV